MSARPSLSLLSRAKLQTEILRRDRRAQAKATASNKIRSIIQDQSESKKSSGGGGGREREEATGAPRSPRKKGATRSGVQDAGQRLGGADHGDDMDVDDFAAGSPNKAAGSRTRKRNRQ
jgi:hypothetical protein